MRSPGVGDERPRSLAPRAAQRCRSVDGQARVPQRACVSRPCRPSTSRIVSSTAEIAEASQPTSDVRRCSRRRWLTKSTTISKDINWLASGPPVGPVKVAIGRSGRCSTTSTARTSRWRLLDDDPNKRNLTVRGVKVIGDRDALRAVAEECKAQALVMRGPDRPTEPSLRELSDLARAGSASSSGWCPRSESCSAATSTSATCARSDRGRPARAAQRSRRICRGLRSTSRATRRGHRRRRLDRLELCRQLSAFEPAGARHGGPGRVRAPRGAAPLDGRAMLDSDSLVLIDIRDRTRVTRALRRDQARTSCSTPPRSSTSRCCRRTRPRRCKIERVGARSPCSTPPPRPGCDHFVNISTDKAARRSQRCWATRSGSAEGLRPTSDASSRGTYLSVALRQRARQPGLGAHVLPGPARRRRTRHRHAPRRAPATS